jgi:hypothetical protein
MAVEDLRLQARQELEGIGVSPESASFLVHDRPSGGWESLVTGDQLRADLADLRSGLRGEIADLRTETREEFGKLRAEMSNLAAELRKEMQSQTRWLTGVVLVGMSLVAGILRVG